MNTIHAENCDGTHCTDAKAEVRLFLLDGRRDIRGACIALCESCWEAEWTWRKRVNRNLPEEAKLPLPPFWQDMKPYRPLMAGDMPLFRCPECGDSVGLASMHPNTLCPACREWHEYP